MQPATTQLWNTDGLEASIDSATRGLVNDRQADGHWVYELEADCTIPAEYVLLAHYLGEPADFPAGVNPPSVKDGAMPKQDGDATNENTVLEFTVDTGGAVKDVRSVYGSQAAAELMGGYLYRWKFSPAMKGDTAVEATGRVLFTKGLTDDAAQKAATIR